LAKSKNKKKKLVQETDLKIEEKKSIEEEKELLENDHMLEKITLIFLLVFLLLVIFIPGDWFNSLSMWVRSHMPGLR